MRVSMGGGSQKEGVWGQVGSQGRGGGVEARVEGVSDLHFCFTQVARHMAY